MFMDFIANIIQEWQWIKVDFNEYKRKMKVMQDQGDKPDRAMKY